MGYVQEPWLVGLIGSHFVLLIVAITSRKNLNFQMFLFLLACKFRLLLLSYAFQLDSLCSFQYSNKFSITYNLYILVQQVVFDFIFWTV